ncbi:hypothetical protein BT96DRAFT_651353 [Gymnopus androsaceus JB14]|uniref:Glycosyl hydrolase family 32 C-terminal domain-containing protein n=1 Tax=Gymnopus androsaceus JB14 TaxID=1447944 RepID=A0A6A4HPK3_9AGAR|nr:hypothetical protein BT96DRAFT_651353 [Gymnopus androsaceus JB14]
MFSCSSLFRPENHRRIESVRLPCRGQVLRVGPTAGTLPLSFTVSDMGPFNEVDVNGTTTEIYEFHGVIDRTILDVFLNGGINAGTMVFFPAEENMLDTMTLTVGGIASGSLSVVSLEAWGLQSGWAAAGEEIEGSESGQLKVVSFT